MEAKEALPRWLRGESKKKLVRQCGLARNTVRRYLAAAEGIGLPPKDGREESLTEERLAKIVLRAEGSPGAGSKRESWSRWEAERGFIAGHVENRVRLSKVRKLLQRRGVHVPYGTLYRSAVEELGFGKKRTTVPLTDGLCRSQLQVHRERRRVPPSTRHNPAVGIVTVMPRSAQETDVIDEWVGS